MHDEPDETLTQDEVYDILSNARRRFVIATLRERDEPVDVMTLSELVAARENETDVADLTDQQVKRVYVSLYQTHIPKLSESGVVEYDEDAGSVRLTERVAELDSYLPGTDERSVRWPVAYLLVAALGLLLYEATIFIPIGITPAIVGLLVVVTFGLLTIAHYLSQ